MPDGEICILAGGLSSRMGRDKSRLRLDGKTLLRHAQDLAAQISWPSRVIRRDAVKRCGPLGGVYTALKTSPAEWVLFLACDMPFVPAALLERLIVKSRGSTGAVFTRHHRGKVGFPFMLRRDKIAAIEAMLWEKRYSLQDLAHRCAAAVLIPRVEKMDLFNINTDADWVSAKAAAGLTDRGIVRAKRRAQ